MSLMGKRVAAWSMRRDENNEQSHLSEYHAKINL